MTPDVLIGADVGGTATRVVVVNESGRLLGWARGGTGNPHAVGLEASADVVRAGVSAALAQAGVPGDIPGVRGAVLGVAGGSRIADQPGYLRRAVPGAAYGAARVVSDLAVTFCSATAAEQGFVLIAGTGAVAGQVIGDHLVAQRDGWGWLLGDRGSGFWLGRQAMRATLAALDEGAGSDVDATPGPLAEAVLRTCGATDAGDLIAAAYTGHPTWLASLAILVDTYAELDPAARAIADRAAQALSDTLLGLRPSAGLPVVLGGSVLTQSAAIARLVMDRLGAAGVRDTMVAPAAGGYGGALGAAWMAARALGASAAMHAALFEDARHLGRE